MPLLPAARRCHDQPRTGRQAEREFSRAAVKALQSADRRRGALQADLALCLTDLFEADRDTDALLEAVALLREAACQVRQDAPVQAKNKMLYGQALLTAAEVSTDAYVMREAGHQLATVAADPAAGAMIQVMAGRDLVRANRLVGDHDAAFTAAKHAVGLLPRLAPQQLRRRDREYRLGSIAGIGAEAAAAALGAGRPERAVELLEQARGVLLGEAMAGRSDLARLSALDPGLAREFQVLRNQLAGHDAPVPGAPGWPGKATRWHRRRPGGKPPRGRCPVGASAGQDPGCLPRVPGHARYQRAGTAGC